MAGTNKKNTMLSEGPVIILVEPQLGENIGMVARGMANFGLGELRLVNPRDGWPNDKARSAASKADHVIDGTRVFETLEEALDDVNFVFATTARARDDFKTVRGPETAGSMLRERFSEGQKCGILFGRERWGLKNHEVALADEIVTFPVNPAFASLNIAQAVLLMSYEWMKSGQVDTSKPLFEGVHIEPAEKKHLFSFFEHIEDALSSRGYFRPVAKQQRMVENLRSVLTRPQFGLEEIHVLRGVISSLDRYSRQYKRGDGPPLEGEAGENKENDK